VRERTREREREGGREREREREFRKSDTPCPHAPRLFMVGNPPPALLCRAMLVTGKGRKEGEEGGMGKVDGRCLP
jgi:hypothetical protein